jgi:asparagine synthase (glutamine-hydrolysing)
VKNDIVATFNGEIYNYKDFGQYNTDGEIIIDLYEQHGPKFTKLLDGEFALCVIDFVKRIIIISTDTFACKPLWYEFNDQHFGIASYNSQLKGLGFDNGSKLYANTTKVFSLDTRLLLNQFENYSFDITQYKTTYDDWLTAFSNSIYKRTVNSQYGVFLGLSSGYDSGAIACELIRQHVKFKSYTITGPENMSIINDRIRYISESELINLTRNEYETTKVELDRTCEDFIYNDRFMNYNIKHDKASIGLAAICNRAASEGRRIYLSGQGADEIISDYGFNGRKIYEHSSFGGKFPDNLNGFFPWHSFYDGTQIQYLNKEEYVAGHYGIETRYPFLDRQLVQEFLWLDAKLKNSKYKSVLDIYLHVNGFPYNPGEKIGFNTQKGLQ